ncbi:MULTISPECIES: hypothetical protein [unclassified Ruegeria]|uniref:hypothetical protein n=1 Tax=unclassified Ruegeria TaxID=2625375 RepID=UPI001488A4AD|nr:MULTISPECIES: hypothetical protein [unclassified Ruegeria]NOD62518.1 hypothetical protein [Ruegeria sp. HKCCD6109]NOD93092.1 hypothetical protein [Ruegeria sp. HKCCD4884]
MEEFNLIVAQQPQWIQIWLNVLSFGAFLLPISLLIWKQTRLTAIITVVGSVLAAVGVLLIFNQLGYVRLMGLGHVVFWTPVAWYLWRQQAREDMPVIPGWIIRAVLLTIAISLVFDYVDVIRYLMGDRTPVPVPA